jgi:hypothetical protein
VVGAGETPTTTGRRALFSASAGERGQESADSPVAEAARRGGIVIECGACRARTPIGVMGLARQLIPSVWVPTRRLSRLMRCPSCRRLTWCRVDWLAGLNS